MYPFKTVHVCYIHNEDMHVNVYTKIYTIFNLANSEPLHIMNNGR